MADRETLVGRIEQLTSAPGQTVSMPIEGQTRPVHGRPGIYEYFLDGQWRLLESQADRIERKCDEILKILKEKP